MDRAACAIPFAQIYDPITGSFTATATPLVSFGPYLTAALLNDGRVLVVGGTVAPSGAEIYDPSSGQFTDVGPTLQPHGSYHTSTVINDGSVLIVGGETSGLVSGAELFDPVKGTFVPAANMVQNRQGYTATLLQDGRVLMTGGNDDSSAESALAPSEIFDPASGTFTTSGTMFSPRTYGWAALLPNGKVVVGGGDNDAEKPLIVPNPTAELWDPASGTFTLTSPPLNGLSRDATATLLPSGQVLVAGGADAVVLQNVITAASTAFTQLYNPASGAFISGGNMTAARNSPTATLLPDGRVLVTGGSFGGPVTSSFVELYTASAELYTPVVQGLVTSQSGVTFRAAPNGAPAAEIVQVAPPIASRGPCP